MGANCCIAARHKDPPRRRGTRFSTHRNVRHSPPWSFQWNNQMHVEDVVDNLARISHVNSRNVGFENKSSVDMESEGLSDGGTALLSFGSPNWPKSPTYLATAGGSKGNETAFNHLPPARSLSISSKSLSEVVGPMKSSAAGSSRKSTFMTPPSAAFKGETSSSRSHSLPADPTSSRKACRSPGYPLSRQTSDSHVTTFKSLKEKNLVEGRQSVSESLGGSSDSWSLRLFSELVASSHRERWSFGNENMSSNHGKISRHSSQSVVSPPQADSQSCGVCSKLLKERSSWSGQKFSNSELSVVAVLVCGHVYHAECLESVTPDVDRFDPSCPVCKSGEKSAPKLLGKGKAEMKGRNKISRNAVADIDLDGAPISEQTRSAEWEAKDSKVGSSSSFKGLGRPFLRRHFSIGSRPTRSVSENEVTRKNFWGRYRRNE